jgi:hypothetical protein
VIRQKVIPRRARKPTLKVVTRTERVLDPPVAVGTHYIEQRYLYAFAARHEVQQYVRTQAVQEDVDRLPETLAGWEALQTRVQAIQEVEVTEADGVVIEGIPEGFDQQITAITADPLFQKTFATHAHGVAIVDIDRLIAAQRTVNMTYVAKLAEQLDGDTSIGKLIEFCLSPRQTSEPIQHLELAPNVHAFTSPNTDLRFLGGYRKAVTGDDLDYAAGGGLPAAAVIAFVGYGASSVNGFLFNRRIYLNNGFHRLYTLRSLGATRAPIVLQQVNNIQLEFPPQIAGLPREYLLAAPRPALMKDFFAAGFTTTVKVKDRMRMVLVNVSTTSQHDVPA